MIVLLLDESEGEFCLQQKLVSELAALGVTNLALLRDDQTVGVVLEGWLFDPLRSSVAAAQAVGAAAGARALHPIMQMAVSKAA